MRESRDEAQTLLTKMWPQMAAFQGGLKKCKGTIEYLQGQNAELAETVAANRENTMDKRINGERRGHEYLSDFAGQAERGGDGDTGDCFLRNTADLGIIPFG